MKIGKEWKLRTVNPNEYIYIYIYDGSIRGNLLILCFLKIIISNKKTNIINQ